MPIDDKIWAGSRQARELAVAAQSKNLESDPKMLNYHNVPNYNALTEASYLGTMQALKTAGLYKE